MTTVTGMTAARMQQIEDESIVNGAVTGGHLILSRHDGTTIDSGSVIGPAGPTGPAGATSIAVCTSTTRPTGGALFNGLGIYETDTKRVYFWDGTAWIYRGGLWICTSSTRPASPFNGLRIYETDTKFTFIFDGTTWIYRGGPIICTAATRPASPFNGLMIYETDTKQLWVYDGTTWNYRGGTVVCTSSTRPTSNIFNGLKIYETDTGREYIYDGAAWNQKSGPANWTTATLQNSWVSLGSGNQAPRYAKIDGQTFVQGHVANGVIGSAAFTLPAALRPAANLMFPAIAGGNTLGRVDVSAAGLVIPGLGSNTWYDTNLDFQAG